MSFDRSYAPAAQISVVIPMYNKRTTIVRAVRSVMSQTFPPAELIVVDDGSDDRGSQLLEEVLAPSYMRVLRTPNRGVSAARNFGATYARSEFVAFLDADDEWTPRHLEVISDLIARQPQAALFTCHNVRHGKSFRQDGVTASAIKSFALADGGFLDYWYANPHCISSSSVCVNFAGRLERSLFREGVTRGEDLAVWIRLTLEGTVCVADFDGAIIHDDAPSRASAKPLLEVPYPLELYADQWRGRAADTVSLRRILSRIAVRNAAALSIGRSPRFVARYAFSAFQIGAREGLLVLAVAAVPKPWRDQMLKHITMKRREVS